MYGLNKTIEVHPKKISWYNLKLVDKEVLYKMNVLFRCLTSNKNQYISSWKEKRHLHTCTQREDLHSVKKEFVKLCCDFSCWKWDRQLKTVLLKLLVPEKGNPGESLHVPNFFVGSLCLYRFYEAQGLCYNECLITKERNK